jgi:hypothetical protein
MRDLRLPTPHSQEGRARCHERGGRDAMEATASWTSAAEADGEIVGSRSPTLPDAGIKLAGDSRERRWQSNPVHRGDHVEAVTPLRREGRNVSACGDYSCAFYPSRGCGCTKHPAFPAPSCRRQIRKLRSPCVARATGRARFENQRRG